MNDDDQKYGLRKQKPVPKFTATDSAIMPEQFGARGQQQEDDSEEEPSSDEILHHDEDGQNQQ